MTVKKNHILTTALALFHQEGFGNIGVDRIIAEAGIAKMTFYKYFPTKLRLIEECLALESQAIQSAWHERLDADLSADPRQKLKAIYSWHHDFIHAGHFHGSLFHKAASNFLPHDGLIFEIIDQHNQWRFELLRHQLSLCQLHKPEVLASAFMHLFDGMLANARHHHLSFKGMWPIFENLLMQQFSEASV